MRVAELVQPRQFRLSEWAPPEPGPGQILARVHAVGICGSDLHNFSEGSVGDMPSSFPMVLGHEPAGTIVATGEGVSGWQPGDRVVLEPAIYCYHCEFCRTGHFNVCSNIRFLSQPQDPGFFRDFVVVPEKSVLPLPANLSLAEGTLFEPLAVALHSLEFVALGPGETVAVFGAGPIGLLTIAALRLAGAARIWAIDPIPARRELALKVGAAAALESEGAVAQILRETGGRGVDAAIDCAAKGDSMNHCLQVVRNAGRVVITGIPAEVRVALEFHVMRRKELRFYNVRRSNHESELALEMLRERPAAFRPVLTHTFPLEKVQAAFELLESYADGCGKLLISLSAGN
ncbi:MAG: alcohol dehydrogenase catalytic domain-containing protein [Acidobacteria bacterium]|nr:alcohol dehydrogenase catalytic domain-containing protein [Acidobacteriota bacterium]